MNLNSTVIAMEALPSIEMLYVDSITIGLRSVLVPPCRVLATDHDDARR
jgi:hypothetical protein